MNEDRPVGSRFIDPVHGELIVVEETGSDSCEGCAYRRFAHDGTRTLCTAVPHATGRCGAMREQGNNVVFARVKDYAVFKVTGEWP